MSLLTEGGTREVFVESGVLCREDSPSLGHACGGLASGGGGESW